MKSEIINIEPALSLLSRHHEHHEPYITEFHGLSFIIYPDVFNPSFTKVSGFFVSEMEIHEGDDVLDMFSGSGAIGILAAMQNASRVIGVDISNIAVRCANENSARFNFSDRVTFREGNLWQAVKNDEKFDVILANPPLLPVTPETVLEMAIADSPEMSATVTFLNGCQEHLRDGGRVYMSFSNACQAYVGDPVVFINQVSRDAGLTMNIKATWDVGYEIYRILTFSK
jgi:methylase of polypeptide subunit release factors